MISSNIDLCKYLKFGHTLGLSEAYSMSQANKIVVKKILKTMSPKYSKIRKKGFRLQKLISESSHWSSYCRKFYLAQLLCNSSKAWLCHAMLYYEHDGKWHQNDTLNAAIMALSYYYLASVRKGLLQAHHDKCCSLVKLLCTYFCYLNLLNHS